MNIEEVKRKVLEEVRFDPFSDPRSWELIKNRIPENLWYLLVDRAGAAGFLKTLPTVFPANVLIDDQEAYTCWERVGNFYKNQQRYPRNRETI